MNHSKIGMFLLPSIIFYYCTLLYFACSSYKPCQESIFSFSYEGKKFSIISENYPLGGGDPYNAIVGNNPNFKAIDYNQDKSIDDVVEGTPNKTEVQAIYRYGLREAMKQGKLYKREWEFIYEYMALGIYYEIRSYRPDNEVAYNEFYLTLSPWRVVKALDNDADGKIDLILRGHQFLTFDEAQKQYSSTLEQGIKDYQIEKGNGKYYVKRKHPEE